MENRIRIGVSAGLLGQPASMKQLVDFYTRHKLLSLCHSPVHAQRVGKLVGEGKRMSIKEVCSDYEQLLIEALRLKTTHKKNMNVLQHIMGCFKLQLTSDEKQELLEALDQYRKEYLPLIVPCHALDRTTDVVRISATNDNRSRIVPEQTKPQ
jgi:uncharacterized protein YbgA (DUF1722 family)